MTHALEVAKYYALIQFAGMPLWSFVMFVLALPALNEWIERNPKWKANTILQAIGNVLSTPPIGSIPVVKQALFILTVFKSPKSAASEETKPEIKLPPAAVLLPFLFLLGACAVPYPKAGADMGAIDMKAGAKPGDMKAADMKPGTVLATGPVFRRIAAADMPVSK